MSILGATVWVVLAAAVPAAPAQTTQPALGAVSAQSPAAAPAGAAAKEAVRPSPTTASPTTAPSALGTLGGELSKLLPETDSPGGMSSTVKWIALVTVLSLAPAILVMVTCFTRIVVVLGLLRQALATQNVPPNQVMFGLAVLMTVAVMAPVYQQVHREAIAPYLAGTLPRDQALRAGERHVRDFMIRQIEAGGNTDDVYLFVRDEDAAGKELTWSDVPTLSLIPAFAVSELKIAFYMGFRIYLPFLIVDMLVGAVLVSMGMLMLPPVLISLPFKLLLFVLADGWHLVVGTLMGSFS
jgi:flagellar biosynthetic protein FliP